MSSFETITNPKPAALVWVGAAVDRRIVRVWIRLLLFLAPIAALIIPAVYLVDPYRVFDRSSVVKDSIRARYAASVNPVLWKLAAFDRTPAPNIILGDSQMARLNTTEIEGESRQPYVNLAYGGGDLPESISTFWYATQKISLKKVYFGVSFMEYNAYPPDRVEVAEKLLRNPATYFLDPDVLETTVYDLLAGLFHWSVNLGPTADRDAFWKYQLGYLAVRYTRNSEMYPQRATEQMRAIVDYCRAEGIEIVFVIPPQHVDAQRRVAELGVEKEYKHFKNDLASLGTTYDYDIESDITRDRSNYSDPFHLTGSAASGVVKDIWSGQLRWAHILSRNAGSKPRDRVNMGH